MAREFPQLFVDDQGKYLKGFPVHLGVSNIEEVGLMEVLQPTGAKFGNWNFLEELIVKKAKKNFFVFKSQLGAAREIKVSLSCLFGRFIARTYLQKYFGVANFFHLESDEFTLCGPKRIKVKRCGEGTSPRLDCI